MTQLPDLSLTEALAKMRASTITAVDLTQAYLDRIQQLDPQIKAYLTITAERALAAAHQADALRAAGQDKPLLGVPLVICYRGGALNLWLARRSLPAPGTRHAHEDLLPQAGPAE